VATTSWGAPIEQDSSTKARSYLSAYDTAIRPYPDRTLGAYVFLWGQKQERTPTWYGMFLKSGEETETIDVLHYIWNGRWPKNRAPELRSLLLDGKDAYQSVTLRPGETYHAEVVVADPDNDVLRYLWNVMAESEATQTGGDFEAVPETLPGLIDDPGQASIALRAPARAGAYRLFLYAFDGNNHAAHANIPFLVEDQAALD
jgi:hypothetical protein